MMAPLWRERCHHMRALAVLVIALTVSACGGSVTDTGSGLGPTTPPDTTKPPTVQRSSITVRVTLDPADAALAQQAGIGVGGLTVRLTSGRAGDPTRTAVTGTDGTARFEQLLEGFYSASVERRLSETELARLSPADREASIFAGGGQVVLSPPTAASTDLALVGARRGSIVISETFAYYGPPERGYTNYVYGTYLEVYNNSDTTAFLDGILIVSTPPTLHHETEPGSCEAFPKLLRLDSTAVYTGVVRGFPGTGRDFPIAPGQAKVVAMDALNHLAADPLYNQFDLSQAEFEEFWTEADVDNPFAVNMTRVYGSTAGVFGRGFGYFLFRQQLILMSPEARSHIMEYTSTSVKVPSEYILDVLAIEPAPGELGEDGRILCVPWTSPRYDRAPAPLSKFLDRHAIRRRSLGQTADGRELLQRTRNSARDFERATPLQRSLAK